MSYVFPGGSNVYVPSFEATGMVVNFVRDPSTFHLNDYAGVRKVDKDSGYYLSLKSEEAARIINSNGEDQAWYDGSEARTGETDTESHQFSSYNCKRYQYPFTLGYKAVQQAAWDIIGEHAKIAAQKAMTLRTIRTLNALKTALWGLNTNTATALGGGKWNVATTSTPYIRIGLGAAVQKVIRSTNGAVRLKDLSLVISPALAYDMSATDEIANYVKSSPFSYGSLTYDENFQVYGLPSILYGVKLIVEDTVQVTTKKGATRSDSFGLAATDAYLVAKDVNAGATSPFNTLTIFEYESFTTEVLDEPKNRRTLGRVVEDSAEVVTAPASGFYISAVE